MLRQRRAVDDHRVLAAGLGYQHRIVVAPRKLAVDAARDRGRAGEEHAGDARVGDQRGPYRIAATWEQLQRRARHPGTMQQFDRRGRDQRRLRSWRMPSHFGGEAPPRTSLST